MTRQRLSAAACALLAVAVLAACGSNNDSVGPVASPSALADFGLLDVNPTSPRADQIVSPRDYLGSVSAWYFGHAT